MKKFRNPFDLLRQQRSATPHGVDVGAITATINNALASAGLTPQSGVARGVTETIQRALAGAGLAGNAQRSQSGVTTLGPRLRGDDDVATGLTTLGPRLRGDDDVATGVTTLAPRLRGDDDVAVTTLGPRLRGDDDVRDIDADMGNVVPLFPPATGGEFMTRSFASAAGHRTYKLYVPASFARDSDERVPLVVMLHGCTQDPDDFAAGTRMNALADRHGFLVAYPAQAAQANVQKCWNWFRAQDQARDSGEPALIAGITREVTASYRIDERRIFVAGLSAGAAMAVVLGETYPDLFAAVGVHSGLPYASAHDVPSAFAAMHGGGSATRVRDASEDSAVVPTIIFHGDQDFTVNAVNADAIAAQSRAAHPDDSDLRIAVTQGVASGGRAYTRTVLADAAGQAVLEQWVVHGAGHAWSGGDASGTFTDPSGPDASAEMVRFFCSQRRAGSA